MRNFGLLASVLVCLLYLLHGLQIIGTNTKLAYLLQFGNTSLSFNLSNTGQLLLVLTVLVWPIAILASWNNLLHSYGTYLALLFSLEAVLIYLFLTDNVITFYILFELSLLPLYLLVGQFGASTERLRASKLLWTYTLLGSLCLLVAIVWLLSIFGTANFTTLNLVLTQQYNTNTLNIV